MHLTQLSLQDFRCHSLYKLELDQLTTLIVGPNASGKTSVIEAIAMLATGSSFRAGKVEEMISFGAEIGRVGASLSKDEGLEILKLDILLTRGQVQGRRAQYRLYSVNDVRRRKKDFLGKLLAVAFRPEDMRLIEGSPGRRRAFLTTPLCVLFPEYERSLKTYEQTLRRRNKLLLAVREREQPRSVLQYWNLSLIKHGEVLQKYRQKFLEFFQEVSFPVAFSVVYKPSLISPERLEEYQSRAIAAGHTLIGPHKDDFLVEVEGWQGSTNAKENVGIYGSRGQQRLAVLWLKVCELAFVEKKSGQRPLLLLDDILSELDDDSRSQVLSLLGKQQSIVTTTDSSLVEKIKSLAGEVGLVEF